MSEIIVSMSETEATIIITRQMLIVCVGTEFN